MPYDINTSLENLEKGLKDIQSAKKQVEQTINTSKELQSIVSGYASSLESLLVNVRNWANEISTFQSSNITGVEESIEKIKISCEKVVESFSISTFDLSSGFKKQIGEELSEFEGANAKLMANVDKLSGLDMQLKSITAAENAVKEKLSEVSKELKDSHKKQDDLLEALKKTIGNISSTVNDVDTSCKNVLNSLDPVSTTITNTLNAVKDIEICIDQVKNDGKANAKQIKSDISGFDKKIESLEKQMETTTKEVKKEVNVNRIIMIVGTVVLTILLFVCK